MFLRRKKRRKDGKEHHYWSIVENRRVMGGRILPRHVLYLGELKGDLAIRPIYHQLEKRIEAHIFISFLSYCLQVTLKGRLIRCASGLTPRAVLEKFAAVQMLDVHFPTTDGCEIVLTRYTQPEKDLQLLLHQLQLKLPDQAPPKIQTPPPSLN